MRAFCARVGSFSGLPPPPRREEEEEEEEDLDKLPLLLPLLKFNLGGRVCSSNVGGVRDGRVSRTDLSKPGWWKGSLPGDIREEEVGGGREEDGGRGEGEVEG